MKSEQMLAQAELFDVEASCFRAEARFLRIAEAIPYNGQVSWNDLLDYYRAKSTSNFARSVEESHRLIWQVDSHSERIREVLQAIHRSTVQIIESYRDAEEGEQ